MSPPPGQIGYFQVNQFSGGATGHVDITLFDGSGSYLGTFGLNVAGPPTGGGPAQGGWFNEDNWFAGQGLKLIFQSPKIEAQGALVTQTFNYLKQQVAGRGSFGSEPYAIIGVNCVDGINMVIQQHLGSRLDAFSLMTPTTDAVYMYAEARHFTRFMPLPIIPISGNQATVNSLVTAAGTIIGYVGQGANYAFNTAVTIIGSSASSSNGSPVQLQTGAIVVTLNQSDHSGMVDYTNSGLISIFDNSGGLVGTQTASQTTYLPSDAAQAFFDAYDQAAAEFGW